MRALLPVYCRPLGYFIIALALFLPFIFLLWGKVTDAMSGSDWLKREKKDSAAVSGSSEGMSAGTQSKPETGILDENMAGGTGSEMTELLTEDEKNVGDMQATELLMEEETTVRLTKPVQTPDGYRPGKQIVMLSDIMLIHTDEILE